MGGGGGEGEVAGAGGGGGFREGRRRETDISGAITELVKAP